MPVGPDVPETPTETHPVVCSIELRKQEDASTENSCIDKWRIWVDMTIYDPLPLSYFPVVCPVALDPQPWLRDDVGVLTNYPSVGWPLNSLGTFLPTFDVGAGPSTTFQRSRSGWLTLGGRATDEPVELWFWRGSATPDIQDPTFTNTFPATPGIYTYHFTETTDFEFRVVSVYQYAVDGGTLLPLYDTIYSSYETLASVACTGSGGGGGGGGGGLEVGNVESAVLTKSCVATVALDRSCV